VTGVVRLYHKEAPGGLVDSFSLIPSTIPIGTTSTIEVDRDWSPTEADVGKQFIFTADITTPLDQAEPNNHLPPTTIQVTPPPPPPPPATLDDVVDALAPLATETTLDALVGLQPLDPATDDTLKEVRDKLTADPATNAAVLAIIAELEASPYLVSILEKLAAGLPTSLGGSGALKVETSVTVPTHDAPPKQFEALGTIQLQPGTPTMLEFALTTRVVHIQAATSNTGTVYIGAFGLNPVGEHALAALAPGDSLALEYDDSENPIYVIGSIPAQSIIAGATTEQ
jgi:hypothetical protein